MYNRFKWDKTIRYDVNELKKLKSIKEPSRIFVGSMIDMYHEDINGEWVSDIIGESFKYPQHTFITLTKFPEHLYYSYFPKNWWIGVTVDKQNTIEYQLIKYRADIAGKIFISFEPLLTSMMNVKLKGFDWIIIGGKSPGPIHKSEWIDDIVNRADKLNIPVYIKENANYKERRKFFPNFKV